MDFNKMSLKELKRIAKEHEIYIGNKSKQELIQKLHFKLIVNPEAMKHMRERS